jgi:hypothetical protein
MHIQAGTVMAGINALQPSIDAKIHQAAQVHQPLIAEDYFRRGAIQSQHADFHGFEVMFSDSD